MLQPTVRRTWAPRGCTPVHKSWDRHDRFSTHGAITISPKRTRLGFYFKLQESNVTAEDVIDFVRQVRRQVGWKRLLIVWDRLNAQCPSGKPEKSKIVLLEQVDWAGSGAIRGAGGARGEGLGIVPGHPLVGVGSEFFGVL